MRRKDIAEICEVSAKTVYNWFKFETMPLWAIKKIGYDKIIDLFSKK
jgi:hypothetical protein